jgi:hypothetical protein
MIVEMEFDFGEMAAIFSLFVGTLPATSVRWFDDVGLLFNVGSLHATILLNRCTISVGRKGGLHPQSLE